jgi:epoxyqueuosine reductase
MYSDLAVQIRNKALELNYEKCGIIKVTDMLEYGDKVRQRIERIPELKPLLERFYSYANLQNNYPWAKAVVVCVRGLGKYRIPKHLQGLIGKSLLIDYRRDKQSKEYQYREKFGQYLQEKGLRTATEGDFGLTGLRWAAYKAGLGIIRKNNFFYTKNGSYTRLDSWLIDEELELVEQSSLRECPESCNLCIRSCPTSSLSEPYLMNMSTCVSYLTAHKESWDLPNEKHKHLTGNWIYGCDVCQDVCPFNHNAWLGDEEFPNLEELGTHISLEKIVEMDYDFLRDVIQPKFWYIKKENVWKLKINALNAMLNNYKKSYDKSINIACNDENEKVREMAEWVKSKTL